MKKNIGSFYFKQTENGNLLGEFSNNSMDNNTTESADIIKIEDAVFIGNYKSSWIENENAELLNLNIKLETNSKIYKLTWYKNVIDKPTFFGKGFIVDKILVGNYQDFQIEKNS